MGKTAKYQRRERRRKQTIVTMRARLNEIVALATMCQNHTDSCHVFVFENETVVRFVYSIQGKPVYNDVEIDDNYVVWRQLHGERGLVDIKRAQPFHLATTRAAMPLDYPNSTHLFHMQDLHRCVVRVLTGRRI